MIKLSVKDIYTFLKKLSPFEERKKRIRFEESFLKCEEENKELKREINFLKNRIEITINLVYEKPYYWLKKDEDKDGPFCQKCWDKDKDLIRLQEHININDVWLCLSCEKIYYGENYKPPKPEPIVYEYESSYLKNNL